MDYRIDLVVLSEENENCKLGLTLHNLSDLDLCDWSFGFSFGRFIRPDSVVNATVSQIGSVCHVTPKNSPTLKANHSFYCEFTVGTAPFRYYSNGVQDAYLTHTSDGNIKLEKVDSTSIVLGSPYQERVESLANAKPITGIIPKPNRYGSISGKFRLSNQTKITVQSEIASSAAHWLQTEILELYQVELSLSASGHLFYKSNPTLDEGAYTLRVTAESIIIESGSRSGFVHGTASLIQLIERSDQNQLLIDGIYIDDAPRFRYRGFMLDCSRHFHSLADVKRLINQLAYYKFNRFHWHLTDDEGWRIEIKALPQLTNIGAWRGPNESIIGQFSHLTEKYGGYYNQEQVREVIAYAHERGIMVIPEIDIPGHCRAAILSLPELLIEKDDKSQYRSIQNYNDNVLNPGISGTYQFVDTVLEEICELFPSPYVHIGADEVPDGVWTHSPSCQTLMAEQDYSSAKELQGHLLRYAEKKLNSLGKRMLGWEEAQHGDKVSKETVIYSWLSENAAIDCADRGFDVVLQPGQTTYLDMTQDYAPEEPGVDWANPLPLADTYRYEPLAHLDDRDPIKKRIWGIQTALWCELVEDFDRAEYMIFPRALAIAEIAWTQRSGKDWHDFIGRLQNHLPVLDRKGIQYRML